MRRTVRKNSLRVIVSKPLHPTLRIRTRRTQPTKNDPIFVNTIENAEREAP